MKTLPTRIIIDSLVIADSIIYNTVCHELFGDILTKRVKIVKSFLMSINIHWFDLLLIQVCSKKQFICLFDMLYVNLKASSLNLRKSYFVSKKLNHNLKICIDPLKFDSMLGSFLQKSFSLKRSVQSNIFGHFAPLMDSSTSEQRSVLWKNL